MKKFRQIAIVACIIILAMLVLVACGKNELTLSVEDNLTSVRQGQTLRLTTKSAKNDLEGLAYEITEGSGEATVSNDGYLTVKEGAVVGNKIVVISKIEKNKSNSIELTISARLSLEVFSDRTRVIAGNSFEMMYAFYPASIAETVTWEIDSGDQFATIDTSTGEVIVSVKASTPTGTVLKITGRAAGFVSNEVAVTVAAFQINASVSGGIAPGGTAELSATFEPTSTSKTATWNIVEGSGYASIDGTTLSANSSAAIGSIIRVVAVCEGEESNILTIKVLSQEDLYSMIQVNTSGGIFTAYNNNPSANLLTYSVWEITGGSAKPLANKDIALELAPGGQSIVSYVKNGYNVEFTVLSHGSTQLTATLVNGNSVTIVINAIKTPSSSSLILPEVFRTEGRNSIEYAFSKKAEADYVSVLDKANTTDLDRDLLPFIVTISDASASQGLTYKFEKDNAGTWSDNGGSGIAEYTNGRIKFLQTGRIRVTVSSNSGSIYPEASVSRIFNVNEGFNVNSWEQLKLFLEGTYNGTDYVNLVVMTKPVSTYSGPGIATYGYDIVPNYILQNNPLDGTAQTAENVINTRIGVNKSLKLNGNLHMINTVNMRYLEYSEHGNDFLSTVLNIDMGDAPTVFDNVMVEINNLSMKGNTGVLAETQGVFRDNPGDFKVGSGRINGVSSRGLRIGSTFGQRIYYITINNVDLSGFNVGARFEQCSGKISKTKVSDIYSNGIETAASILEFSDMTYGACGAVGIEITPDKDMFAPPTFNQAQKITFTGSIVVENFHSNGAVTVYFQRLTDLGLSIPQVLNASLAHDPTTGTAYTPSQLSNVIKSPDSSGGFYFIALLFNNTSTGMANASIIEYADAAGVIDLSNTSKTTIDTTHKYIVFTIIVYGTVYGRALVYNHNYIGA